MQNIFFRVTFLIYSENTECKSPSETCVKTRPKTLTCILNRKYNRERERKREKSVFWCQILFPLGKESPERSVFLSSTMRRAKKSARKSFNSAPGRMRSAASSDSIPLHEITGFLSVEKDDRSPSPPRHCARTNENAKSRRYKARFTFPAGRRVKGCRQSRRGDPSAGDVAGVGT